MKKAQQNYNTKKCINIQHCVILNKYNKLGRLLWSVHVKLLKRGYYICFIFS